MQENDRAAGWVLDLYEDVDAMDRERIGRWLSATYEVRYGNNPPIRGREDALDSSERFWATIRSMRHDIREVVIDGNRAVVLADVTYVRLDGNSITMPVATYVRRSGEREIDRLQVYADLSPLYSRSSA